MKVKVNKTPMIVLLSIAAAFLLAAVLAFVVPMIMPKPECPVEITETVSLKYSSYYGSYVLQGKLTNITDETVVIRNNGGMSISFSDSNDKFTNYWYKDNRDIVLEPGETYDFENCYWALNGSSTITQMKIKIDGTTYYLVGSDSLPMVLAVIFLIVAIILLVCGISSNKQQKAAAARQNSLVSMCESIDEDCVLLEGIISNKNESKKAVAKSTVSVLGGIISAMFLGFGAYKVYSGAQRKEFVLGKNGLYMLNNASNTANGLYKCTKENFAVEKITTKKNTINLTGTDQVTTIAITVKKNTIPFEQAVERLNDIFIVGTAPAPIEDNVDNISEDPFAFDSSVTAQPENITDELELNNEPMKADDNTQN